MYQTATHLLKRHGSHCNRVFSKIDHSGNPARMVLENCLKLLRQEVSTTGTRVQSLFEVECNFFAEFLLLKYNSCRSDRMIYLCKNSNVMSGHSKVWSGIIYSNKDSLMKCFVLMFHFVSLYKPKEVEHQGCLTGSTNSKLFHYYTDNLTIHRNSVYFGLLQFCSSFWILAVS